MLNSIKKILLMLSPAERRAAIHQLGINVTAVLLNVISISSILPFLYNVAEPGAYRRNPRVVQVFDALGFDTDRKVLLATGVLCLVALIVSNVIALVQVRFSSRFQGAVTRSLSTRLFEVLIHKPYPFFLENDVSSMASTILQEAERVVREVLVSLVKLVSGLLSISLIVLTLFLFDPHIALCLTLAFSTSYLFVFLVIRRWLTRMGAGLGALTSDRLKTVTEPLRTIKEVKILARESYFTGKFSDIAGRLVDKHAFFMFVEAVPKHLIETVAFGSMVMVTLYIVETGNQGSGLIPLMGLYAFAAHRLLPEFRHVFGLVAAVRFHIKSLDHLTEVLAEAEPSVSAGSSPVPLRFKVAIEMRGVAFRYAGASQPVVEDLSCVIKRNTVVGLVGKSGAGKSTIVNLILGLLPPTAGEVSVDGVLLSDPVNVRRWQRNIGYVPQDPYLFDDTIARNIAIGAAVVDQARVEHAARVARAYDFVTKDLPHGFETRIGEGGVRLSGGQRQRIAIARALYDDPEVLVFDEATNALDVLTEQSFYEAIADLLGKKTLIVVTHRMKTVEICDQILFVGRQVETGTFEELCASSPSFRAMATTAL